MSRSYSDDKAWEESWLPYVIRVIPPSLFLSQAAVVDDMERVTDVMVAASNVQFGVRIRYPRYYDNYHHQVTIRCRRDSGAKTEWEKILEGHGDLFFYGFANPHWQMFRSIRRWTLFSLHAVRRVVQAGKCPPLDAIPNGDGTYFHALDIEHWSSLDSKFVVASNW